jgi:hypothetical protein
MRITTVFIVLCVARIAAADPFVGTWKLRPMQSGAIATETIAIDTTATGYRWNYDITLRNNNHVRVTLLIDTTAKTLTVLTADGRQIGVGTYKVTGTNAWRIDSPRLKSSGSISADGKTMSIHDVTPYDATVVFDKT